MNWSKAKTILILFLLCTNIFLLSIIINSYHKRTKVPEEVINSTVALLNGRNIKIDSSLIPAVINDEKIFSVENVISDYESFARLALKNDITPTDNGFSSDNASIKYKGDRFYISFTEGIDTPDELKSPADKAKAYLKGIGIEPKNAEITVTNDANGVFTVAFTQVIDNKPFFDCKVSVELDKTKIMAVYGCWFTKDEDSGTPSTLESVPGLLVKFSAQNPDLADGTILKLKSGYAVDENESGIFHKQTMIIPVLEITMSDENKYYIDARSN